MNLAQILANIILSNLPRSTEDWSAGDLAICIDARWPAPMEANPTEGELLRVERVCLGGLFLHFVGRPANRHWLAVQFRKVKPDTEPAADEQWVDQLRHLKRKEPV